MALRTMRKFKLQGYFMISISTLARYSTTYSTLYSKFSVSNKLPLATNDNDILGAGKLSSIVSNSQLSSPASRVSIMTAFQRAEYEAKCGADEKMFDQRDAQQDESVTRWDGEGAWLLSRSEPRSHPCKCSAYTSRRCFCEGYDPIEICSNDIFTLYTSLEGLKAVSLIACGLLGGLHLWLAMQPPEDCASVRSHLCAKIYGVSIKLIERTDF